MDQLTGLPTHKDLAARPGDFLPRDGATSAILLDIDGLAWVNIRTGHREGDAILTQLGDWLSTRSGDLAAHALRVAGDEFLLLLPGRSRADALSTAQSLVTECAALEISYERPDYARKVLTLSAVVFAIDRDTAGGLAEILERAATRLYEREVAEGRDYGIVTSLD
jgi:diguanylate cyclase (GGDEF)-like protein